MGFMITDSAFVSWGDPTDFSLQPEKFFWGGGWTPIISASRGETLPRESAIRGFPNATGQHETRTRPASGGFSEPLTFLYVVSPWGSIPRWPMVFLAAWDMPLPPPLAPWNHKHNEVKDWHARGNMELLRFQTGRTRRHVSRILLNSFGVDDTFRPRYTFPAEVRRKPSLTSAVAFLAGAGESGDTKKTRRYTWTADEGTGPPLRLAPPALPAQRGRRSLELTQQVPEDQDRMTSHQSRAKQEEKTESFLVIL